MTELSDESNLTLTRYLYSLEEVKYSLFLSILNRNSEEALFWLYEIYYSGFPEKAFELIINIFNDLFVYDNADLIKPFNVIITNFEENPSENDDVAIGTMVNNMCLRKYRLEHFMVIYFGLVCEPSPAANLTKKHLYLKLKRDNILQYKTKPFIDPPYMYLRAVCKYPIRKEGNQIFCETGNSEFKYLWFNHWLYFAYRSPIWKERIDKYGGASNHETKKILFYNENGQVDEDLESNFYDKWNMDTDEQPIEVINNIVGSTSVEYLSVTDFCNKYGGLLKKRTINKSRMENTIIVS